MFDLIVVFATQFVVFLPCRFYIEFENYMFAKEEFSPTFANNTLVIYTPSHPNS